MNKDQLKEHVMKSRTQFECPWCQGTNSQVLGGENIAFDTRSIQGEDGTRLVISLLFDCDHCGKEVKQAMSW